MSASGQKATFERIAALSPISPKADIRQADWGIRFVPKADIQTIIRYD